jgi:hypothetical protein
MNLDLIGLTLSTAGEVTIGVIVIIVHHRILKDRRIDEPVLRDIRVEQAVGAAAIALMVAGYVLQAAVA